MVQRKRGHRRAKINSEPYIKNRIWWIRSCGKMDRGLRISMYEKPGETKLRGESPSEVHHHVENLRMMGARK